MATMELEHEEPLTRESPPAMCLTGSIGASPALQPLHGCGESAIPMQSGLSSPTYAGCHSTHSYLACSQACRNKMRSLCLPTLSCTTQSQFVYESGSKPKSPKFIHRNYLDESAAGKRSGSCRIGGGPAPATSSLTSDAREPRAYYSVGAADCFSWSSRRPTQSLQRQRRDRSDPSVNGFRERGLL